jgi:hypothetical protein
MEMKFKTPTDEAIATAIWEGVDRSLRITMGNYIDTTSRRLASQREDEIREIEATGRKVTRIEYGPDGRETLVSEALNYQSPPDDYERYDSLDALGYYAASMEGKIMKEKLEEVKPGIYVMDDPLLNVINGPHMYSDDCYCMSCAGHRAKRDAGMHVDIENVKREAELCRAAAIDEHQRTNPLRGYGKSAASDPLMSIPCSVVLALCDKADGKGSYWKGQYDIAVSQSDGWFADNESLRAELKALRRELAELREGTVTDNHLNNAVKARRDASSMFPGAVEGVSYSKEQDSHFIGYSYSCTCGIHHSNQSFPQRLTTHYHSCACGRTTTVWNMENKS